MKYVKWCALLLYKNIIDNVYIRRCIKIEDQILDRQGCSQGQYQSQVCSLDVLRTWKRVHKYTYIQRDRQFGQWAVIYRLLLGCSIALRYERHTDAQTKPQLLLSSAVGYLADIKRFLLWFQFLSQFVQVLSGPGGTRVNRWQSSKKQKISTTQNLIQLQNRSRSNRSGEISGLQLQYIDATS